MGLGFRLVKMLDISYITVIYFIIGFVLARLLDTYVNTYSEKKEKKKILLQSIFECIGFICLNAILIYICRNVVELIPSPFDGLYGLDHSRVKELSGAPTLAFALLFYQTRLQAKLKYVYNKLS
jgi:hypothetical protein